MYTYEGVSTIFVIPELAIVYNFAYYFASALGKNRDDQETGDLKDGKFYHQGVVVSVYGRFSRARSISKLRTQGDLFEYFEFLVS
jgi:hypothetical protein